ncbi:MAG: tRNA lysidine(34) synthetase TilS, partial [Pelagibacteraceae bacterium]|nr:tRNA lysidine(34) synthetase TilS [Pelagibacteraceae bacterium]
MKKKNSTARRKRVKFDNKHLNDPKIKKLYLTFKKQLYSQINNEKFCIGVSGGPDSLALAFLCKIFSKEFNSKFIALIIDHNLRKQSGIEARKVKIILTKHKIRAKVLTWKDKIPKSNIQFNARNIRYFLLNNECNKLNIKNLVLAHHEGDLIENFFIRLFRGSGLKGLSSLNIKGHSENNI